MFSASTLFDAASRPSKKTPSVFSLKKSLTLFREYDKYQAELPRPDVFLNACAPTMLKATPEEIDDWRSVIDLCLRQMDLEWMTPTLAKTIHSMLDKFCSLDLTLDTEINDYVLYMLSNAAISTPDNRAYITLLKSPYWQSDYALMKSEKTMNYPTGYVSANTSSLFNISHTKSMLAHHSHVKTERDCADHVIVGLDAPWRFDFAALRYDKSTKLFQQGTKRKYDTYITAIHDSAYLRKLYEYSSLSLQVGLRLPLDKHGDTMMSPHSFNAALESADMTMNMVSNSFTKNKPAIVITRPPGHHAGRDFGEGFCLINNIACAAMLLIQKFNVQNILIVDIDAHKGNGTLDMVCHHPLFIKHVVFQDYYNDHIYQGSDEEHQEASDAAQPAHVHQEALPSPLSEENQKEIIQHIAHRIEKTMADFVLVSFGLDGHKLDPLGGDTGYSDEFYTSLVLQIFEKTKGRCAFVVEGGYNQTINMRILNRCIELLEASESAPALSPSLS